jgi:nucleotide-binding universal stress UspA family protein
LYGSTLQAVLLDARVPVLAIPLGNQREAAVDAPLISPGPVLSPVDFSPESLVAAQVAAGLAHALDLKLSVLHAIVSPTVGTLGWQHAVAVGDRMPSRDPNAQMAELAASLGSDVEVDVRVVHGEPAEQIARYARETQCAFIVMSLGSSAMRNRRPGSIACRVLRLAPAPVLALPEIASGRLYVHYLHRRVGAVGAH